MKFNGETPGPLVIDLFLPRKDKTLHIKAGAVLDWTEFDTLVPSPKPPTKRIRGGASVPDFENKDHIVAVNAYGSHKTNWMILQSLKATPEITWETIERDNPQSWANYDKEMKDAGFSSFECQRIIGAVLEANSLNDKKIEEAREAFLSAASQSPETV